MWLGWLREEECLRWQEEGTVGEVTRVRGIRVCKVTERRDRGVFMVVSCVCGRGGE